MSDTGWVSPGTVVSDSSVGSVAWNNPSNATTSDNSYAAIGKWICISEYLKATNFGFSVPAGSTIDGIEARYEKRHALSDAITDEYVRIVKSDGTFGTENKADTSTPWTGSADVYTGYGGSTDLWNETWSVSNINDSDFGVALSIDNNNSIAWVDHIQIKVYYTESGTEANSERGLYIKGGKHYSRESSASLGTDDSNLSTIFSEQDYTDVGTDNDTYVDLEGTAQYFEFLFKEPNTNENNTDDFRITWKGKSTLAPSSSTVYLQVYNRTTMSWETLDSDNTTAVNTKFTLEGTLE